MTTDCDDHYNKNIHQRLHCDGVITNEDCDAYNNTNSDNDYD